MSIRKSNVLVTGGAGFIGSHLVDRLIAEDPARLVVVDNFFLGDKDNLVDARRARPDLEVVRMDASDLAAMQEVVAKHQIASIFDLAVVPLPTSLEYPMWTVQTNIGVPTTCCELARRGLVQRVLHCSSSEAYGTAQYVPMDESHPQNAVTPYAASKSAADKIIGSYAATFDIDATIVRPFNNFGPRQNPGSYAGIIPIVVNQVSAGVPIKIHGDGKQTRDFIFVKRTADALVNIFENEKCRGAVINVATGHETTILDLVTRILRLMGKPDHPVEHTPARPGDVMRHCADVSLAADLLGFVPQPFTDEELRETIDWYLRVVTA